LPNTQWRNAGEMAENRPTPQAVLSHLHQAVQREIDSGMDPVMAEAVGRYGAFVGSNIEAHPRLPRAMDYARSLINTTIHAESSVAGGTVILADTMSKSKGRFTRHWHAPPGGIWGCMIHAETLLPQSRRFIPLATGLACLEAVRYLGGEQASLRWVNDVLAQGRKLAGFLVESYTEPIHGEEFTLVGFGINGNNSLFPEELAASSISLQEFLGKEIDLTALSSCFLSRLAWNFGLLYYEEARELRGDGFSGKGGGHLLLERWLAGSDSVGRRVLFGFDVLTAPQYPARVLGLSDDGGLILELEDGHIKTEYSGEIRYLDTL